MEITLDQALIIFACCVVSGVFIGLIVGATWAINSVVDAQNEIIDRDYDYPKSNK